MRGIKLAYKSLVNACRWLRWLRWVDALFAAGIVALQAPALAFTYSISEQEIQAHVASRMPVEVKRMGIATRLEKPVVRLRKNPIDFSISTDLTISMQDAEVLGKMKIGGLIVYQKDCFCFYLRNPRILELSVGSLAEHYQQTIKVVLQIWVERQFARNPIHVLSSEYLRSSFLRSTLHSVTIEDEKLILDLRIID